MRSHFPDAGGKHSNHEPIDQNSDHGGDEEIAAPSQEPNRGDAADRDHDDSKTDDCEMDDCEMDDWDDDDRVALPENDDDWALDDEPDPAPGDFWAEDDDADFPS